MIDKLRSWFRRSGDPEPTTAEHDRLQFSVAVLLAEIARADYDHKDVESSEILNQLAGAFGLSAAAAADLLDAAREQVEDSVSLHDFTSAVHAEMNYEEKEGVIEMLWRIALADKDLDKYEDYMVGKIADLLYVYRGDVIRLKQRVIDAISATDD